MTDNLDLTQLRMVAEKATPGPWKAETHCNYTDDKYHAVYSVDSADSVVIAQLGCGCCDVGLEVSKPDTAFVITFDPTTVLALIERIVRAEQAVQRVEDVLSKDSFSVQEDGFCADDIVDCDEIRDAIKGLTQRQRNDAEKALRELHEEVWTDDPAPGGFVCKECGVPVESEPCDVIRDLDGGDQV